MAQRHLVRAHEARADEAVVAPVLAGAAAHRGGKSRTELRLRVGLGRGCHQPGVIVVQHVEHAGIQPEPCSVSTSFRSGMALEDAAEDQVPQRPVGEPRRLDHEHRARRRVLAEGGDAAPAVVVDGDAEFLAHRPDRVVVGRVQRRQAGSPVACRAAACRRVSPPRQAHRISRDRLVDVVEEDLRDAGPAAGCVGAEVGEPAVVGAQAGPAPLVLLGVGGGAVTSEPLGKNGGMVLGKTTSATMPSASSSAMRRSEFQLRSAPCRRGDPRTD